MNADDYIRGALEDVETTARRIPYYQKEEQPTLASYAAHVVLGRFVEVALLTNLRRLAPELADQMVTWIAEVQADPKRLNEVLSRWESERLNDLPFTTFGPASA